MVTCPYCGTTLERYQPNCPNCGAALTPKQRPEPEPAPAQPVEEMAPPPPAPRPVNSSVFWRLYGVDAAGIVGFVLALIGLIFTLVGAGLTIAVVTAFVGTPFLILGVSLLAVGGGLLFWRLRSVFEKIELMRNGTAVRGELTYCREDWAVRINMRPTWASDYTYMVMGVRYEGSSRTIQRPLTICPGGREVYVLYDPARPEKSILYLSQ